MAREGRMSQKPWGQSETQYFYQITPDVILKSVEDALARRCTGRVLALNSMENRVYEIELESDDPRSADRFVIAKFYRPGRWTWEQILEEHEFLHDLVTHEVPVVPPLRDPSGSSLFRVPEADIFFAVFPKQGGRTPQELELDSLPRVGRLLARLHAVGAGKTAKHRLTLDLETYGTGNLKTLLDGGWIPEDLKRTYQDTVEAIITLSEPHFARTKIQRIHGDCHLGNLLWGRDGFFWVDFDDMLMGPPVQDLWLLLPGRDLEAREALRTLLEAYQTMWPFDERSLILIEPLRALRFVHFSAWIAKRWQDPYFVRAFPHFAEPRYWHVQVNDLKEQLNIIKEGGGLLALAF